MRLETYCNRQIDCGDGPRSLKDMMGWKGEEAESYIQDYKMNLLIPSEMKDAEIETLQSSLREVFYFLKYAGDWKKLEKILDKNERFRSLEKEAAVVISTLTNTEIKIKESEEKQDIDRKSTRLNSSHSV